MQNTSTCVVVDCRARVKTIHHLDRDTHQMDHPPLANLHIHQRLLVLVLRIPHNLVPTPLNPILAIRRHPTLDTHQHPILGTHQHPAQDIHQHTILVTHQRPTLVTHQRPIQVTHRLPIQAIRPYPIAPLTPTLATLDRIQDILLLSIPLWVE